MSYCRSPRPVFSMTNGIGTQSFMFPLLPFLSLAATGAARRLFPHHRRGRGDFRDRPQRGAGLPLPDLAPHVVQRALLLELVAQLLGPLARASGHRLDLLVQLL